MSKLNQEELLELFKSWKCDLLLFQKKKPTILFWGSRDEQAYQQMKEMIQKPEVTEEWIEEKALTLFVILNILKPSSNDVENIKTFIRTLYRESKCLTQ